MSIEVERRDHLLLMGVRRPQKMNALSRDMCQRLRGRTTGSSMTRSCGSG